MLHFYSKTRTESGGMLLPKLLDLGLEDPVGHKAEEESSFVCYIENR